MIGEFWIQSRVATADWYDISCIHILVTQKLQVVCRCSTYPMTPLLSEMSIFCVRAEFETQMASYASKHASQSLFDNPFYAYSVLRCITWKVQVVHECSAYRTTAILSEIFVWFRVAIQIRLESYSPRHTSVVLWYHIVCIYCKPLYTSLFGTQRRLTTKLAHLMTAYYSPNDGFTVNNASFASNKGG